MTDTAIDPADNSDASGASRKPAWLTRLFRGDLELLIVLLLGIVSVATAYASFQAALYDSQMAGAYARGQNAQTEAESLYLEANQQYIQDVQTWARLTELTTDMDSVDPVLAAAASAKFDSIYFVSVSADFEAAIAWSNEQNDTDPDNYSSPLDSEDYQAALFGAWADEDTRSENLITEGDRYNGFGDRLTLNTVLMAITLFLLGVAAVVRRRQTQLILIAFGGSIFVVAAVLTVIVPFAGLG
jgi:Tfp pilus assembly protein PilE